MGAIIFDLNGTLVDSERAHWMAYHEVLSEYRIDFTFEEFSEDWTCHGRDLEDMLRKHGREDLTAQAAALKLKKDEVFSSSMIQHIRVMPGAAEAVQRLSKEFVLAVDSTSKKDDVVRILSTFGLEGYFKVIGSCDMPWDSKRYGKNSKSSRFRSIADTLCSDPSRCLVVGDAEKDVRAAKLNNMSVIIVPTETTRNNDFAKADLVLSSLRDLTTEIVRTVL